MGSASHFGFVLLLEKIPSHLIISTYFTNYHKSCCVGIYRSCRLPAAVLSFIAEIVAKTHRQSATDRSNLSHWDGQDTFFVSSCRVN